ncbi:MAG: hypothetical protein K1X94_32095 [Sandaracinaceae bacterium]|nr:hypothetical protein [Sandaracinaceae bacterium]
MSGAAPASLAHVQDALSQLYDLRLDVSVDDFACDETLARALGGEDAIARREVLFVIDDELGTHVGLYVDDEARRAAALPGAWGRDFEAMCLATEGVSHFMLVQHRAAQAASVRELELELQAEIDKFASSVLAGASAVIAKGAEALLAGNGVGLLRARSRLVRQRLFEKGELRDAPGTERAERYRAASQLAERYTRQLERAHLARGDVRGLVTELRRFYRLGFDEKLARCGGA